MSQFRRLAKPLGGFLAVFNHALAVGVHEAKVVHRIRISQLRRLAIPLDGFLVVFDHALAVGVHEAECVHRIRISSIGFGQQRGQSVSVIALGSLLILANSVANAK